MASQPWQLYQGEDTHPCWFSTDLVHMHPPTYQDALLGEGWGLMYVWPHWALGPFHGWSSSFPKAPRQKVSSNLHGVQGLPPTPPLPKSIQQPSWSSRFKSLPPYPPPPPKSVEISHPWLILCYKWNERELLTQRHQWTPRWTGMTRYWWEKMSTLRVHLRTAACPPWISLG